MTNTISIKLETEVLNQKTLTWLHSFFELQMDFRLHTRSLLRLQSIEIFALWYIILNKRFTEVLETKIQFHAGWINKYWKFARLGISSKKSFLCKSLKLLMCLDTFCDEKLIKIIWPTSLREIRYFCETYKWEHTWNNATSLRTSNYFLWKRLIIFQDQLEIEILEEYF